MQPGMPSLGRRAVHKEGTWKKRVEARCTGLLEDWALNSGFDLLTKVGHTLALILYKCHGVPYIHPRPDPLLVNLLLPAS